MKTVKIGTQAILLSILIAMLGVPPAALRAYATQQEGPVKPAPTQQPGAAPPQPSGQQQPSSAGQAQSQAPQVAISVQSNVVNIDAVVTDQDGNIITGLKRANFRVLDEDKPQQISNFGASEAPITIVILMEFSSRMGSYFGYRGKYWAYNFLEHLNQKDWVAVKTFDLKTNLVSDFTQDKKGVEQEIASLYFPDFHEANLFDAVLETMDQLREVKGKKSILIIASGYDTFSKHTLDQTFKRVKETDVTIFFRGDGRGAGRDGNPRAQHGRPGIRERQLFAGGKPAEDLRGDDRRIRVVSAVRRRDERHIQFRGGVSAKSVTMGFTPLTAPDGRYHKLKVEVVDEAGDPLTTLDKKGHKKKVVITARQGYTSPKPTAGD